MKSINERIVEKFDAVGHWGTSRPQDYYKFVAECIMERMCGFRCSHTVSVICQEVGYLTVNGNTTKLGRMFAHSYYVLGWRGE